MESGIVPGVPGDDQRVRKGFRRPRQALGVLMGKGERAAPGEGSGFPLSLTIYRVKGGGGGTRGFPRGGAPTSPGYVRWGGRGAHPLSGLICPFPLAHKAPNACRGLRNPFRTRWSSPGTPGTIPDSNTLRPIYRYSPMDHSGTPRHVRDLIRDSEQPSVTTYYSHYNSSLTEP